MTQDERNMLAELANKIAQTPAPPRDAEAEDFIRKSIGSRPDALYLMTQTVLIQNMALQQSQHQIQDLQQRLSQPVPQGGGYASGGGSFLGQNAPPSYGQGQYPQQPQQYQTQQSPYMAAPVAPPPSGMSSFLRGAAQTAAGVAAGTLAIQGIESLFSHHSGFGGGEGMFGGGGGIGGYGGGETVIENNYYGGSEGGHNERFADGGGQSMLNNGADIGPQDDDVQTDDTQDADYDNNAVDDSSYDDSSDNFS